MAELKQRNWDVHLFTSFYLTPDKKMFMLIHELSKRFEFEEAFLPIYRRTPIRFHHRNMSVAVFVSAYLPKKFSNSLWDKTLMDVPAIVNSLTDDIDVLEVPNDHSIREEERKMRKKSSDLKAADTLGKIAFGQLAATRRTGAYYHANKHRTYGNKRNRFS